MLTKTDFNQIRKIIREEIKTESADLKDDLQGEMKLFRIELQREIRALASRARNMEIQLNKIQKDIKKIVNFFDQESLELRKRIERVEEHFNLPSTL